MKRIFSIVLLSLAALSVCACGNSELSGLNQETGGITATAIWPGNAASGKANAVYHKAPAEVAWVRMSVSKSTTTFQADFAAAAGSGSIANVPVGSGWTLTFQGLNAAKTAIYFQGSKSGITVVGGTTTNAGSVAMFVLSSASGMLDTSFDTDGKVYSASFPSSGTGIINGMAIQPDGKIVTAGSNGSWMGVARYLSSGATDTSFGTSGLVTIPTNSSGDAKAVAIQPDGKIVVAGYSLVSSISRFTLSRRDSSGNPDSSLGGTGIISTPVGTTGNNGANAIALLPNSNIVAAGYAQGVGANNTRDFAVGIYTATTGSLISSVTTSFFTCTGVVSCNDEVFALAIQGDGKIVAAGVATADGGENMAVARYSSAGVLDTSFNGTGKVAFQSAGATSCQANSVALQPDGKIVIGGYCVTSTPVAGRKFALARLNANGTMDTSFNGGVVVYSISGGTSDQINAIKIQPDGKIVVAGSISSPSGGAYTISAIARFLTTGTTLDSTFNASGTPGTIMGSFNGMNDTNDEIFALGIQSDGKIIVAGKTLLSPNNVYALARYWNDVTTKRKAYVVSTGSSIVAVTDLDTNRVYNIIDLGIGLNSPPTVIAVNPNANRAYVAVNNNDTGNTVLVLDTIYERVIGSITVGTGPNGFAIDPSSNRLYVTNVASNSVTVIDTSDNSVIRTITGFSGPRGVAVNPRTNRLYVANATGSSVTIVDTLTNTIITTISLTGTDLRGVAANTLTNMIYVAKYESGAGTEVAVIDGTTNLISYVNASISGSSGPTRLAVNEASNKIYIGMYGLSGAGTTVSVIDAANSNTVSQITGFPAGPRSIAIDSKTNMVYVVSSPLPSSVTAIDTMSANTLHPTTWDYATYTFNIPDGIAIAP